MNPIEQTIIQLKTEGLIGKEDIAVACFTAVITSPDGPQHWILSANKDRIRLYDITCRHHASTMYEYGYSGRYKEIPKANIIKAVAGGLFGNCPLTINTNNMGKIVLGSAAKFYGYLQKEACASLKKLIKANFSGK